MHKLTCLLVLVCFSLTSCCTVARGTSQAVEIVSEPPGAQIQIDGLDYGMTPQTVKLARKRPHQVILAKEGYEPQVFDIQSKLSPKVATNILIPVGCVLVGTGIALALTGGTVSGLAGGLVGTVALAGGIVGITTGAIGTGVDLGFGSAHELSPKEIRASLRRLPPYAIN